MTATYAMVLELPLYQYGFFLMIIGHRLLWEKADILHCDVHIGNILIKDEKQPEDNGNGVQLIGNGAGLGLDVSNGAKESQTANDPDTQKDHAGMYYFLAVEMLRVPDIIHNMHHDLESFYWVLVRLGHCPTYRPRSEKGYLQCHFQVRRRLGQCKCKERLAR
ncbi:hypothetical protein C8Q78DRAFT_1051474 [Trametes maxima]|nr:hypothetical protein C8Q78DRAFT_1051474 [Trametes maxima]